MKIIKRIKILLSVLQEMGGELSDAAMQQLLFLYCHEFVKTTEFYEFIPLEGSPYSLQAKEDKKYLIKNKLLANSDDWMLAEGNKRFASELNFFEKIALQDLKNKFAQKTGEELTKYIAENYPYYSEKSIISENDEIIFYTIGYEGLSLEAYINLLLKNQIRLLVDVRKNAFSQKYGFSKGELSGALGLVGVEYRHVPELGIISEKRQELVHDKDYEELFLEYEQTTLKNQTAKLAELQQWLEENRRIAITCFEAQPHQCHRSRVAKALKQLEGFNYKIENLELCKHLKNHKK